ncbi:MAG: hypothetical protein KC431_29330, partial [Myxococcales bacterium]|nr:hypothetical protein [Myxococcales bacterium]
MPQASAQLLRDYLGAVRRIQLRRGLGAWGLEFVVVAALSTAVVVATVGYTLRGDLGAIVGPTLGLAALGLLTFGRLRALRLGLRSPLTIARGIARAGGPLRMRPRARSSGSDARQRAELERDAILRHEILGATELWQLEPVTSGASADWTERSPELAAAYIRRIGATTLDLDPRLALPLPYLLPRIILALTMVASAVGVLAGESGRQGLDLLLAAEDGRPPPPPQPVWTSLELELVYPAHTHRSPRRVTNPSGSLRMPAGTVVNVDMVVEQATEAVRLVMIPDSLELSAAPEPEVHALERVDDTDGAASTSSRWRGSFVVRGSGSWVVALVDDDDDRDPSELAVSERRSVPMPIELEVDAPPEVELLPLPATRREARETDRVELRFSARDDFGVVSAELVYELGEIGEERRLRLPAGEAPGGAARSWRHRYSWDLSAIPLDARSEVSYWIEVRDNDPGLGLQPLVDGPGKVAASARQQLVVHDSEAEHAENIRDLQAIR